MKYLNLMIIRNRWVFLKALFILIIFSFHIESVKSQRQVYEKIETAAIHCPKLLIHEVKGLNINIKANDTALSDLLNFLNSLSTAQRVNFWADADRSGTIQELYFNFRGYKVGSDGELEIELTIAPPVIDHKTIKKSILASSNGSMPEEDKYIYTYDLSWYVNAGIRIIYEGNVLLDNELFNTKSKFEYVVAHNEKRMFYDELELKNSYEEMKDLVFQNIERTALIISLMKAKSVIENSILFAYHPTDIYIGTAKSLLHSYPELDMAQSIARDALLTFLRDYSIKNLLENLDPAKAIWANTLNKIEKDDNGSYNDNVRAVVYNNLAVYEVYAYNFNAAADLVQRAMEIDKRSRQIEILGEFLSSYDLIRNSDLDMVTMENRFVFQNYAVGYKPIPDANEIGEFFSRHKQ